MERAGAAEGEEREVARVVAAGEAHHPDRTRHPVVGDAQDRRRRLVGGETERASDGLLDEIADAGERHRGVDGEEALRVEPAEDEVGVGDGRPRPAAAEADRPGRAPALSGPTWSMPASSIRAIEPPPAPIVCTSTIGTRIGIAYRARARRRPAGTAVLDQRDVGAGASHVVGDEVREAGGGADVGGGR